MCEDVSESEFYSKAKDYWARVSPTLDGVLGGFGVVSEPDIEGSEDFLKIIFQFKKPPGKDRALDCGAGIGRITKNLLAKYFDKVDLVEQDLQFLNKARESISPEKAGNFYCCGLQDFKPVVKYDVIWCQWVLGHLTDADFISFMSNCKDGLAPNGLIIVKENVTSSSNVEMDKEDFSVTRPYAILTDLFERSGLKVTQVKLQKNFPKGLYKVKMIALMPKPINDS